MLGLTCESRGVWCRPQAQRNPPAVLVDGYNVLMMWLGEPGDLERKARVAGSLEAAREELLRDLSDFSGFKRFRIMVAFDAHGNTLAPALSRCLSLSSSEDCSCCIEHAIALCGAKIAGFMSLIQCLGCLL